MSSQGKPSESQLTTLGGVVSLLSRGNQLEILRVGEGVSLYHLQTVTL